MNIYIYIYNLDKLYFIYKNANFTMHGHTSPVYMEKSWPGDLRHPPPKPTGASQVFLQLFINHRRPFTWWMGEGGERRVPRGATFLHLNRAIDRLLPMWSEFACSANQHSTSTIKEKAHIPLRSSCYFDYTINKPFGCSRCVICVSCSVQLNSTYYVCKGS